MQAERQRVADERASVAESFTYVGVLRDHDERRGTSTHTRQTWLAADLAAGTSLAEP